ncbi:MAG: SufS family cysteine desulfurase [Bacteroidales bacterium]|nr:SufS family cysteine desulfurase [Candidatus Cryptobacteroides caccocaballi]
MATSSEIRKQFPILERKVYGKNLVYLDNAATAQRPRGVIDTWNRISVESNANIHRAVHLLSSEATDAYEAARDAVRDFLNASDRKEIIFTSGTTASINLVAFCFGEAYVHEGDEIIVSAVEHHSNIVPWQLMCIRKKASLKVIPVDEDGHLMIDALDGLISDRTRIIAVTQISNVLGIVNPVKEIISKAHARGIPVLVDGAQGIVHCNVDVQDLDCDFYAFSGHKLYAATGTGVLYAKKKFLEEMPPYMGGGEMVGTVTFEATSYADIPHKYEAGTQNFASSATLKDAVELCKVLRDKELESEIEQISVYMENELKKIEGLRLYGISREDGKKIPLYSFTVDGVHHEDLALILDKMGIAVRSGQMCAEPVMTRFGVTGMLRASFAPYNTMEEAEYFIKSLKRAIAMLKD